MHELAITENIIKIASEEAEKHRVKKVMEIRIEVGELTGLIPACIQHYFDIVSKGTPVEGAKLVVKKLPISIRCSICGNEEEITKSISYSCSKCDSYDIKIIGGNEFLIQSLEVE